MNDQIEGFIAAVRCAVEPITDPWSRSVDAVRTGVAQLTPVAEQAIITSLVVDQMGNSVLLFVTGVHRADDAIVDVRGGPRNTALVWQAALDTVTEEGVVTPGMVWFVYDLVGLLITAVHGAGDPIVQRRWFARLAIGDRVTPLGSIAEERIIARSIAHLMNDAAFDFAATIDRAPHIVIHLNGFACLTAIDGVADLGSIAEETIITGFGIGNMFDKVSVLITTVHGASHPIREGWWYAGLAAIYRVTHLGSVTE